MKVLYTARATATGGRDGDVRSDDGILDFDLAMPKGLGGPGGQATNPEQLFAAGYAACFANALKRVAREQRVDWAAPKVEAEVGIGRLENSRFGLAVTLKIHGGKLEKETAKSSSQTRMRFIRIRTLCAATSMSTCGWSRHVAAPLHQVSIGLTAGRRTSFHGAVIAYS